MARLPLASRDTVPEQQRADFDELLKGYGEVPRYGPSSVMIHVPKVHRMMNAVNRYLRDDSSLPKKLQGAKSAPQAVADIQTQLQGLVAKRFVTAVPYAHLAHFPRYLKAINVRLEKLRAEPLRDTRCMNEWLLAATPWQRAAGGKAAQQGNDPKLAEYRWLLEELRVSLFAQELKTPMPVSAKRLQKIWDSMLR